MSKTKYLVRRQTLASGDLQPTPDINHGRRTPDKDHPIPPYHRHSYQHTLALIKKLVFTFVYLINFSRFFRLSYLARARWEWGTD